MSQFEKLFKDKAVAEKAKTEELFREMAAGSSLPKELWLALNALYERNVALGTALAERLAEETASSGPNAIPPVFNTAAILAPASLEKNLSESGFSPLLGDPGFASGSPLWYLRVPFQKMDDWLNKPFVGYVEGQRVQYVLQPCYEHLSIEKMLRKIADLYGVSGPLLFSPWSRKAVTPRITAVETVAGKLDPALSENGLENILETDKKLFWNGSVTYSSSSSVSHTEVPDGDAVFHTWVFDNGVNEGTFILPDIPAGGNFGYALTRTRRGPGKIEIASPAKFKNHWRLQLNTYDDRLLPKGCEVFKNYFAPSYLASLERIRTRAQLDLALKALAMPGFSIETFSPPVGEEPTRRYNSRSRLPDIDSHFIKYNRSKGGAFIDLLFSGDPLYLCDYAEYALNFLENAYPEYIWRGFEK